MNDLKKPTSLITGTNIIFSVGSFLYLYKKIEQLEKENAEMKKNQFSLANKINKFTNEDIQTEELLKDMNKKVSSMKRDFTKVDDLMLEQESIIDALAENDIAIKHKKKSKNKKPKYVSEEEMSSEYESPKKKYKKKENLNDDDLINMLKTKR